MISRIGAPGCMMLKGVMCKTLCWEPELMPECLKHVTLIQRHTKPTQFVTRFYDGRQWAYTIVIKH